MKYELSGDEQLEYSVIAYPTNTWGAKYNACVVRLKNDQDPGILIGLTGRGDTPMAAIADLFNQADRLVTAED